MGEAGSNQPGAYLLAQGGGCGSPVLIDLSLRPLFCSISSGWRCLLGLWSPGQAANSCLCWALNLLLHLWATPSLLMVFVTLQLGWRALNSSHFWKLMWPEAKSPSLGAPWGWSHLDSPGQELLEERYSPTLAPAQMPLCHRYYVCFKAASSRSERGNPWTMFLAPDPEIHKSQTSSFQQSSSDLRGKAASCPRALQKAFACEHHHASIKDPCYRKSMSGG